VAEQAPLQAQLMLSFHRYHLAVFGKTETMIKFGLEMKYSSGLVGV